MEPHEELAENLGRAVALGSKALARWQELSARAPPGALEGLRRAFDEALRRLAAEPERLATANQTLGERLGLLWEEALRRPPAQPGSPPTRPARGDRRYRDPAWDTNPWLDLLRRSHQVGAEWLQQVVEHAPGLEPHTARQARFFARQLAEALAPANSPLLNPEVLRATLHSRGRNLVRGMERLREDVERGQGMLVPRMVEPRAFELGRDLAATPGEVIYETPLFQLIQYRPSTPCVYRRPLVIIPPWINKYYVLDLRPENSFIRWAVERGYTVFLLSWINPDERFAEMDLEDYLLQGLVPALDAVERATGERQVLALGYCSGGTLLAAALAWWAARGEERVHCATLLAAQVDFSEPGDLAVFIDPAQLERLEDGMRQRGYLEGSALMGTFNLLRAGDLVWSFAVDSYLLGREPPPLDFLYWNSDPTRLPARAHATYLRDLYLRNRLVQPGALSFGGVPLDLRRIQVPVYLLAAREDHIAPARSVFQATRHVSGPVRFVLAGSGHVAGIVHPPSAGRYGYRAWEQQGRASSFESWLEESREYPGSWWTDWDAWLVPHAGAHAPPRQPGHGELAPIEPAPGRYVRVRAMME
ncbi:alpha/beta hydrolase [Vitiosangium sp. GDMCC 1.1324]|uniref:PHA/PHB synthase family protein n=1 Tax=Vitiosangium sp. (strain GDMCC 1.1324) TaxID=2138576 RepID=UPI000D39A2E6|nr:class I poly(R)-hydroxyalkanoic acid synthase [Vitiosangium sp. GDMCC 1.1324]PTL83710.1 class I poly(R)-hydroxyalkanoic acid synthase [Vitiosangium sp. GDMCC 1.1324]